MSILFKILKKIVFLIYAFINLFNFHFNKKKLDIFLNFIRISLLRICGAKIGNNSSIHPQTMILKPDNLVIGENSNIGSNSKIFNYSKVSIGDNVDIGTEFYVNTDNHVADDVSKPLAYQGYSSKEIIIGSDIWIGARVTLLSGIKIENRIVVAAGSVVNKNLESGFMYAGVPASQKKKL